ncbi:MAG: NAD(P)/FAD-dependent oxidoreductase [Halocynthiibacter sp.]
MAVTFQSPERKSYDVVIVGGAMIGASVASFLAQSTDFTGSVLVVERDPSFEFASTSHTNSCIRQQFSSEINVKISQFGVGYLRAFRDEIGDMRAPDIHLHEFGYLYLAQDPKFAAHLKSCQKMQANLGAGTVILSPDEIAEKFPFYDLGDVILGSYGSRDEGYFDGNTMCDWWRRTSRDRGVEYITNAVVDVVTDMAQVTHVVLETGERIALGTLVNAAGPRAAQICDMAGITIPVEPRKRYTYVVEAQKPLTQDLPLTVDPSGVHVRTDGAYYMIGCAPDEDGPVAYDDFYEDHGLWENKVWPAVATRIPQFEALKVINSWVGHYAYNRFDQNAILGPHDRLSNFVFANGFSGHGFQQAPAVGRGLAEWITYGGYRSLDLSSLGYARLDQDRGTVEHAVI